jgi:hypothetical protein
MVAICRGTVAGIPTAHGRASGGDYYGEARAVSKPYARSATLLMNTESPAGTMGIRGVLSGRRHGAAEKFLGGASA